MKENTEKSETPAAPPSVKIRILQDTTCRLATDKFADVKKGQVVDAHIIDGPGLVAIGKAELVQ